MKQIKEILNELDLFKEYLNYKIDIIANDPKRWLLSKSKYNLPTFEYYIKNCVEDKGGNYDFTVRRYKSPFITTKTDVSNATLKRNVVVNSYTEFSMWMGTPYNYKDIIINE